MLPQLGLGALIGAKTVELDRDRSLAALRTQTQIDLVKAAAPGRGGQRRDQPLRQPGIVDNGVEPARPRALAPVGIEIVDHDEVEIRTGRQLTGAEPAEAEHGDAAARQRAVIGLEGSAHRLEACADDGVGDGRIGSAGLLGREDAGQEARPGEEADLARRVAHAVEEILEMLGLADEAAHPRLDPLLVVDRLDEGRIDDGVEDVRRLRHRVGEARRRAEKIGEEQAQAIVRLEDGQELDGRRHAAEGAVEREQRSIRVGGAAERGEQGGHQFREHLARPRARYRGPAAEMPAAHGLRRSLPGCGTRAGAASRAFPGRRPCR